MHLSRLPVLHMIHNVCIMLFGPQCTKIDMQMNGCSFDKSMIDAFFI